jgi:CHAT domain-containing protein/tetratricopeptide (TPR) repeat protein
MKVAVAAVSLLVCVSPTQAARATSMLTPLEPGTPVTRALAQGEIQRYRIELTGGACLRLTASANGIGVIVTLLRPDGSRLTHVDVASGRPPQTLVAVAGEAGSYVVEVQPLEVRADSGEYRLALELRSLDLEGRRLLEAQTLFADGQRERRIGTAPALAEAMVHCQKALGIWRSAGMRWWEMDAAFEIAEIRALHSQNAETLNDALELLALANELGSERTRGRVLNLKGYAQRLLGDPAALGSHEEALAIWARLRDPSEESDTHNSLGIIYFELGERQRALEHFQQGLTLKRLVGDKAGEASFLTQIGSYYNNLEEFQRASEYFVQALALRRAAGDLRGQASTLASLSQSHASLGQTQAALETAREALRLRRETGHRVGEGDALFRLARACDAAGQRDEATAHYKLALDLHRATNNPRGQEDVLRDLGRRHLEQGETSEALVALREAVTIGQSLREPRRTTQSLTLLARAEQSLGDYAAARQHSEAALALAESLRASLPGHALRGSQLAAAQRQYDFHIDLLMQMYRRDAQASLAELALEIRERSRARGFLELLSDSGSDPPAPADPALRQRDRELEKRLSDAAERQMRGQVGLRSPEQAAAISAEIHDLTRDHDLVEAQIRASSPDSASFLQSQPLTVAEIQAQVLDDRTVLLEYHLGAERSYLWAVAREGMKVYDLPKASEIEAMARRWHDLLSAGPEAGAANGDEARKQAVALSAMLIAPAAGQLRDRRLLIVADGTLQYIPFAALPSPGRADAAPLVVDHEVVSAPSASLVAFLRRHLAGRSPARKVLAVLADPVFDAGDERIATHEPKLPAAAITQVAEARTRDLTRAASDVGLRDGTISRLPFTRREAMAILSLVAPGQRMVALDFAASRATATSPELAQYRYVHFATHGFANSAHPELSGIVLSLVDAQGREQSGFLPASQVFNLKLPAELVVLSGCRTALGKEIKGEGLLGLTRAFMSAGAGRVVASLWKVDDAATAELMKTMYERILRDGQRPAQALRSAQIAMWQARRWNAPYYWAAFVIQGEWN